MAEKAERLRTMYKIKKIFSGIITIAICASMTCVLSGCNLKDVTIYETPHDCGELTVSSIEDMFFEENSSPEKIARKIPDFCICKGYYDVVEEETIEEDYTAFIPQMSINETDFNCEVELHFNADKEFKGWRAEGELQFFSDECEEEWKLWYDILEDTFGEPRSYYEDDKYCSWNIGENIIRLKLYALTSDYLNMYRPVIEYRFDLY